MDSFEVIIAPKALEQLNEYIGYIRYTLLNPIAAELVWNDAVETQDELMTVAGSLKLCDHPVLHQLGYHAIGFKKHKYVMLYRLDGNKAYVEGIYHQMQDYENTFASDL